MMQINTPLFCAMQLMRKLKYTDTESIYSDADSRRQHIPLLCTMQTMWKLKYTDTQYTEMQTKAGYTTLMCWAIILKTEIYRYTIYRDADYTGQYTPLLIVSFELLLHKFAGCWQLFWYQKAKFGQTLRFVEALSLTGNPEAWVE